VITAHLFLYATQLIPILSHISLSNISPSVVVIASASFLSKPTSVRSSLIQLTLPTTTVSPPLPF